MKIIAITQARLNSSRLPSKVVKKVKGETLLEIHIKRILRAENIDKVIIATTTREEDHAICELASQLGVACHRGSEEDVLDRFYQAALNESADYVVRLTSDCPLIDPQIIDLVIDQAIKSGADYSSNTLRPTYPDGMDVEVFKFDALKRAWLEATKNSDREHVTPYIWRNSSFHGEKLFKAFSVEGVDDHSKMRLTVDQEEDFKLIQVLIEELGVDCSSHAYVEFLLNHPDLQSYNAEIIRNEGLIKSIADDK